MASKAKRDCQRLVMERAEFACERCGKVGPLTFHHRLKRSHGGGWTADNIVLLCGHGTAGCHGWVEHNPNAAEEIGFHVRPWQSPAEVPIKTCLDGWVYLNSDGRVREREQLAPEGWGLSYAQNGGGRGGQVERGYGESSALPQGPGLGFGASCYSA